jgi:hypothetical protein
MNIATTIMVITLWREGLPTCGHEIANCTGYFIGYYGAWAVSYIPGGLLLWGARRSEKK